MSPNERARRGRQLLRAAAAAAATAATAAFVSGSWAHETKRGDLAIAHPFVSVDAACDPNVVRAYLMLVANSGAQADRLTGASLDRAGKGALLRTATSNGKASRTAVTGGIEIAPGGSVALLPPDYVIEFPKTGQALVEGGMVKGSLTFQRAGQVPVQFMVQAAHPTADGHGNCGGADAGHAGHADKH